MAHWRLIFIALLILCASACRKESEIAKELETGAVVGQQAYQILAAWTVAEEFAFGRWQQFASKQIQIRTIDSLYTDGDGVVYEMDFGNGIVCVDGIKRSGKCSVTINQENFPIAGELVWQSDTITPFAFVKEDKRIELKGSMNLYVMSADSTRLSFDLYIANEKDTFRAFTETAWLFLMYEQPIQGIRKSTVWNGMWSVSQKNKPFATVTAKKLQNQGTCFSLWNAGRISVFDSNNEAYEINIDPFASGACDLEFSVTKGKGLTSQEMVFKAW